MIDTPKYSTYYNTCILYGIYAVSSHLDDKLNQANCDFFCFVSFYFDFRDCNDIKNIIHFSSCSEIEITTHDYLKTSQRTIRQNQKHSIIAGVSVNAARNSRLYKTTHSYSDAEEEKNATMYQLRIRQRRRNIYIVYRMVKMETKSQWFFSSFSSPSTQNIRFAVLISPRTRRKKWAK